MKERNNDFVFCSDLHLKKLIWKNRPQLHSDTYKSFEFISDYAVEHSCDLILGGDVFDSPYPSTEDIHVAKTQIDKVKNNGNEVFWIDGNHDLATPSWSSILGATDIHRTQLCFKGVKFYAFKYTPEALVPEVLSEIPEDTSTLICHQLLDLAAPFTGSYNFRAENVPDFIQTVLMGDLHEHATYYEPSTGKEFKYNGSTAFLRINEPAEKYFYHAVFNSDLANFEFNSILIPTRKVYSELLNDQDDIDYFTKTIQNRKEDLKNEEPIMVIHYDPNIFDRFTFLPELKQLAHVWVIPNNVATNAKDVGSVSFGSDVSPRTILKELIREQDDKLFSFCAELLEGPDFEKTIEKCRSEYGLGDLK